MDNLFDDPIVCDTSCLDRRTGLSSSKFAPLLPLHGRTFQEVFHTHTSSQWVASSRMARQVLEMFPEDDQKLVKDYLQGAKQVADSTKDYFSKLQEHTKAYEEKLRAAAAPASRVVKRRKLGSGVAASSSSSSATPGTILNGGRQYPASWPNYIDLDVARSLMPPDCRLHKDIRENRWKASYPPWGCVSRSWPQHGEEGALKDVARICWQWRVKATGLPCPIADLIEP